MPPPTKRKTSIADFFSPNAKKNKASPKKSTESLLEPSTENKQDGTAAAATAPAGNSPSKHKSSSSKKLGAIASTLTEPGWAKLLGSELQKPYFQKVEAFVAEARKKGPVWPATPDIFTAFNELPLDAVKVVIIGQDPYFNPNQGHGLCFSVNKGIKIPPSLNRIYKEIAANYPDWKHPNHGYLLEWAKRGVLLLNATLTVSQGKPNSHAKCGWQMFTDAVIKIINAKMDGIVFMLWGGFAQKKGSIVNRNKHHVLECAHPSPMSGMSWHGNKHFLKANEILKKAGKDEIDW
eukprot:CAMPEP_0175144726 /NCGR_PEP_ID=MMETSP0087-20121206/14315_1 /TAXON_ID=136419 /ORGANISM="Unknown Unknown, Strain D1" /LENGTH=291 /DNA_ID=CAMNT_0016429273 /DNA_START=81 /DNA_END=953 /DNA_ORIENTATION=-